MDTDDIAVVLNNVDMFVGLSPRVLKRIASAGRVVQAPAGAEIVHAGEPVSGFRAFSPEGVEMHVILTGTATVRVNGQVVGTLIADDYFGELALIDGKPRSADVVAGDSGLSTWALPKWEFDAVVKEHPEMLLPILQVVVARLRRAEAAAAS
jgi:CRP/FNR family transcriptional regulator, cyclic AMP receptor protein